MVLKEKVLKEEIRKQKIGEVPRYPFDEFWFSQGFDTGWDGNLAEIGKVIDEEIKTEQECMKKDKYEEQEIEHINQIEMANKIKQKLGIK